MKINIPNSTSSLETSENRWILYLETLTPNRKTKTPTKLQIHIAMLKKLIIQKFIPFFDQSYCLMTSRQKKEEI